jgi:hypothetical protein
MKPPQKADSARACSPNFTSVVTDISAPPPAALPTMDR